MKSTVLLAGLTILFTATFAAPKGSAVTESDREKTKIFVDSISDKVGINISAVIKQTHLTRIGLKRVAGETLVKVNNLFAPLGPHLAAHVANITEEASSQSHAAFEPTFDVANKILTLISSGSVQDENGRNQTTHYILHLIHEFVDSIETSIFEIQKLIVKTIVVIYNLLHKTVTTGNETAKAFNVLISNALKDARAEFQPLLNLLYPLLKPGEPSKNFIQLTTGIFELDIRAIISQVNITLRGLDTLFTSACHQFQEILVSKGKNVTTEIKIVLDEARGEAESILKPMILLIELIVELLPADRIEPFAPQKDVINAIIEQLFGMITTSIEKLKHLLVVKTVNKLVDIAIQSNVNTTGQIEVLFETTFVEAKTLVRPLLLLFSPILPGFTNQTDEASIIKLDKHYTLEKS